MLEGVAWTFTSMADRDSGFIGVRWLGLNTLSRNTLSAGRRIRDASSNGIEWNSSITSSIRANSISGNGANSRSSNISRVTRTIIRNRGNGQAVRCGVFNHVNAGGRTLGGHLPAIVLELAGASGLNTGPSVDADIVDDRSNTT